MEYDDHEACLSEVRRAVEGERSTHSNPPPRGQYRVLQGMLGLVQVATGDITAILWPNMGPNTPDRPREVPRGMSESWR